MKISRIILSFLFLGFVLSGFILFQKQNNAAAQLLSEEGEKIHWHSFQEAVELSKKEKKKVFIDVYTQWCGWCKVMEKNTFTNPVIAKYVNKHFYAVKLDAEMKDTIVFNNYTFVNPPDTINPSRKTTHQLAASLLNNRLSYPTTVYLDENFNMLTQVASYLPPDQLEPILKYFGENAYFNTKWEDYQKIFKGEITAPPPPITPPH